MINFLLRRGFEYTVEGFLSLGGSSIAGRCRALAYEDAFCATHLDAGCYVFADLERLSDKERSLAAGLWRQLSMQPDVSILNHPTRTLTRYELLRRLEKEGVNDFRVRRVAGPDMSDLEFPVFLRREDNHSGPIPPLLHFSSKELTTQLIRLRLSGYDLTKLIAVEFCDTSNEAGLFEKYGAYILGDQVLPRHLRIWPHWLIKSRGLLDDDCLAEELDYIRNNPHEETIRSIARLAGVEYGRIDYALKDGHLQVWEINTNPKIQTPPHRLSKETIAKRWKQKSEFFVIFCDLLGQLDRFPDRTFRIEPALAAPPAPPRIPIDEVDLSLYGKLPYKAQIVVAKALHRLAGSRH